jgi:hypothetical protein
MGITDFLVGATIHYVYFADKMNELRNKRLERRVFLNPKARSDVIHK